MLQVLQDNISRGYLTAGLNFINEMGLVGTAHQYGQVIARLSEKKITVTDSQSFNSAQFSNN